MITHTSLGDQPFKRSRRLKVLVDNGEIFLAGNAKLKIYGALDCSSGKRMKVQNRVFFSSETEAVEFGYRPCGHCMQAVYKKWKIQIGLIRFAIFTKPNQPLTQST